jgi:hypothetical protein
MQPIEVDDGMDSQQLLGLLQLRVGHRANIDGGNLGEVSTATAPISSAAPGRSPPQQWKKYRIGKRRRPSSTRAATSVVVPRPLAGSHSSWDLVCRISLGVNTYPDVLHSEQKNCWATRANAGVDGSMVASVFICYVEC